MATKRYLGKTCVYCGQAGISNTGDHVIARAFFVLERRANLPIVPACTQCNDAKSRLEHYLATVLPFGGRHSDAISHLSTQVQPRLERNQRLAREIFADRRPRWRAVDHRTWTIDGGEQRIDQAKFLALCRLIAKGLAWHHWHSVFADETTATYPTFLSLVGSQLVDPLFSGEPGPRQIKNQLGDGTFRYEGVRDEASHLVIWRMTLLDVQLTGDPQAPNEITEMVYVFMGPKTMRGFTDFVSALGVRPAIPAASKPL